MATLTRLKRTQVNASPNQFNAAVTGAANIVLVGFTITNSNTSDAYVSLYNNVSGVVSVGTTLPNLGALLIPASSQIYDRSGTEQNPLGYFPNGLTVAATTTETGNTSPTNQLSVELFYYA